MANSQYGTQRIDKKAISNMKKYPTLVYVSDPSDDTLTEMIEFCENNLELVSYEVVDVSDASYTTDTVAAFKFTTNEDTVMFKLRFGIT